MFRSIRWTMQIWHAAILAGVLIAFGSVMLYYLPLTEYGRIDYDLSRVAFRVSSALRPAGPPNGPRPAPSGPVGTDYQNLAAALKLGNLPAAQQAFAQLQKDRQFPPAGSRRGRFRGRDSARKNSPNDNKNTPPQQSAKSQKTATPPPAVVAPGAPTGAAQKTAPNTGSATEAALLAESPPGSATATSEASPTPTPPGTVAAPLAASGAAPGTAPITAAAGATTEAPAGPEPRDGRGRRTEVRLELSEDLKSLFDDESDDPYYYVVWPREGGTVLKSKFAPDVPLPDLRAPRREPFVRQRGEYREAVRQRRGDNILVGRSIAGDVAALHEKEWMVAAAGLLILAAGLLGGHWFSRRAIRPIEAISATAADISLSNLSRRIDVTGTQTELTGLARTLNQMFDRIESAFNQQVRFTADASHELRTPVAVILSHSELALDKPRPAEELRETIETCRRSALRMRSLIESLLTLARFDSGEVTLDSRPFDLVRTVGDCVALVKPLAAQRRITIQTDLAPAMATGDPDRIAQVITNLLTNALRYNHDQGQVLVTLRCSPAEVVLCVADTGIGIPPENLAHIFERFYRVDNARSRKDGGVGLGLAICKSIVMAHGGLISVSSHLNQGTKFEVRLPKAGSRPPGGDDIHRDPQERKTNALAAGAVS